MPCGPGFQAAHRKVWITWGLPEAPWRLPLSGSYELWIAQLDPEWCCPLGTNWPILGVCVMCEVTSVTGWLGALCVGG